MRVCVLLHCVVGACLCFGCDACTCYQFPGIHVGRHADQTNPSRETCSRKSTCKPDPLFAGEAKQAVLTIHSDVI